MKKFIKNEHCVWSVHVFIGKHERNSCFHILTHDHFDHCDQLKQL